VTPGGVVRPLAILATPPPIAEEIRLLGDRDDDLHPAKIGHYCGRGATKIGLL
jgi:hypothetical protein